MLLKKLFHKTTECVGCGEVVLNSLGVIDDLFDTPGFWCNTCLTEADVKEVPWHKVEDKKGWPTYNTSLLPIATKVVRCEHNLTPFVLPNARKVYLSARCRGGKELQGPLPDTAVYLDASWVETNSILTNDSYDSTDVQQIHVMWVKWGDGQVVPVAILDKIVRYVLDALEKEHNVEIGCIGGHGRTGTLAAALCVKLGEEAEDALMRVWEGYCDKAVETVKQEGLVFEYEEWLNGEIDKGGGE